MRPQSIPVLVLALAMAFTLRTSGIRAQAPSAPTYYLKATIPVPTWANVDSPSVDIVWVSRDGRYAFLGDRSSGGGAVTTFDAQNYTFIGAEGAGTMAGNAPTGSGGPNGVVDVGPNEVAAGDGNSTLKVVNIATGEVQSISTGGTHRLDELAYDPQTDTLLGANDADKPPFVTIFKVHPLSIVGQIDYSNATNGLEQSLDAGGKFWFAVPATTENPGGEIDLIDPTAVSIVRKIAVGDCKPTGLVDGINGRLVTASGCVIDPTTGDVITKVDGAGGDETASVPALGVYAWVTGPHHGPQKLYIGDAYTNQIYQSFPVGSGHINPGANQTNGEIWVPDLTSKEVLVFAPTVAYQAPSK